jgi:hypothetical protein
MSPAQQYAQGQAAEQRTQGIRANSHVPVAPVSSGTSEVKNLLSRLKEGEALTACSCNLLRARAR